MMQNGLLTAILGGVAGSLVTIFLQLAQRLWGYYGKENCVGRKILKELEKEFTKGCYAIPIEFLFETVSKPNKIRLRKVNDYYIRLCINGVHLKKEIIRDKGFPIELPPRADGSERQFIINEITKSKIKKIEGPVSEYIFLNREECHVLLQDWHREFRISYDTEVNRYNGFTEEYARRVSEEAVNKANKRRQDYGFPRI